MFGVAVVALPASIITAGYLQEMQDIQARQEQRGRQEAQGFGGPSEREWPMIG